MFPRVLLPTDFSPHAERTVQCIAEVPNIGDLAKGEGDGPARKFICYVD